VTWSFRPRYSSCIGVASNRNEYLRYVLPYVQRTFPSRTIGYCIRGFTVKCCSVVNALSLSLPSVVPSFLLYLFLPFLLLIESNNTTG